MISDVAAEGFAALGRCCQFQTGKRGRVMDTKTERVKVAAERLDEIADVIRRTLGDDDELGWPESLEEVAEYLRTGVRP